MLSQTAKGRLVAQTELVGWNWPHSQSKNQQHCPNWLRNFSDAFDTSDRISYPPARGKTLARCVSVSHSSPKRRLAAGTLVTRTIHPHLREDDDGFSTGT